MVQWHKRFIICPPDTESRLEYDAGAFKPKYMPNIDCHLEVTFVEQSGSPHSTADVAYLADGETYRSDDMKMTNKDAEVEETAVFDPVTLDGFKTKQMALAHELGHMLGQTHIGTLKNTQECQDATSGKIPTGKEYYFSGGSNAWVCYGWTGNTNDLGAARNIMGGGMLWEEVNSGPWKTALAILLNKPNSVLPSGWTVSVGIRGGKGPRLLRSW